MHSDILIDITMTAVRRPEILKRTLHSFFKNCFAPIMDRCRLVINIDPIGDAMPSHELVPIIGGFFKHYYVHLPMTPSFPHAFKWVWQHASAPFVFHLEDDWELLAPVDIIHMIRMLEDFPRLASLRLPFFPSSDREMKNWNLFFPWNGYYFECPKDLRKTAGFAGHPALLRGDFVRECAPLIDVNLNPEKQFHGDNDPLVNEVLRWQYGVYSQPNSPKILKDIGALWKAENNFQKAGSKAFFTQWEQTT
jgi:hypothetical protein